jgi:hypothetical protein
LADDVHGIPVARAAFISSLQLTSPQSARKGDRCAFLSQAAAPTGFSAFNAYRELSWRRWLVTSQRYWQSNLSGSLLFIRHVPWPKLIPFFLGHGLIAHDTPPEFFVLDEREC